LCLDFCFFFFQAEDGIRDFHVTGVQTCALPIFFGFVLVIAFHLCPVLADWFQEGEKGFDVMAGYILGLSRREIVRNRVLPGVLRSEERRVGKERRWQR